jgi:N-acyl-D-aspartate/D-glutamate deacylase
VTTVIGGNCGFSIAPAAPEHHELLVGMLRDLEDMSPETLRAGIAWEFKTFGEYLDAVERRRPYLNWAGFVGHSAIRISVMGAEAFEREASTDEIAAMARLAAEGMAEGAIGVATTASPTGRNCPTRHARWAEVVALMEVLKQAGRGVGSFVPGRDMNLASLYELQPEIGRPFTWTALLASDDGAHRERAAIHRLGTKTGADVHPQVSCRRLMAQTTLATAFALRCPAVLALDRASLSERMAAYADPAWRQRASQELEVAVAAPRWNRWMVAESGRHPELVGQVVADGAAAAGLHPLDFVLDLSLEEDLTTRFNVVLANADEDEVLTLLNLDGAVLGLSDAGAHPDQICDAVMPTDLLGGWVRDRQALPLERAVRKLTGEQADMLGLPGRGYLRPGMHADLVVFDPATVGPGPVRRVRDLPADGERLVADAPTGIAHIVVNGTAITRDGRSLVGVLDEGPGQVMRSTRN